MTAASSAPAAGRRGSILYTPELLGLAVSLADFPLDGDAGYLGEARSVTCGSTVAFSCAIGGDGRISSPGVRVSACAVGQAAAALFVASAAGRDRQQIAAARDDIARWLSASGPAPDWPGLAALEPARAYPARHGAILLAWNAALAALPKETSAS